jgi:hypothetical protein
VKNKIKEITYAATPVEGATVDVSADDTHMTGVDMNGTATAQGFGKYSLLPISACRTTGN